MAQTARLAARLQREMSMLHSDPPPGVSAWLCDGHCLTHLQAHIHGPEETAYVNGIFKLDIQVPERYPFEPPNIKFVTPVYHPNIDNGGRICLDLLNLPPKGAWRPSLNLSTLLASIGLLLAEPNPDDGLMGDISAEYKHDRSSFDAKARQWTERYANQIQENSEVSQELGNCEPDQNTSTALLLGEDQTHRSRNLEDQRQSISASLMQSPRRSLSVSKRLTLDGRTAFLQETGAPASKEQGQPITSVNPPDSSTHSKLDEMSLHASAKSKSSNNLQMQEKQLKGDLSSSSQSILEETSLQQQQDIVQSLNRFPIQKEQNKDDVAFKSPISECVGNWKSSISTEGSSETYCNLSTSTVSNEAANSGTGNMLSQSVLTTEPLGGKGLELDSAWRPPTALLTKMIGSKSGGDDRSFPTSGQKRKDPVNAEKENRPPKLCLTRAKINNAKQLAGDKEFPVNGKPMNESTDFNNASCGNTPHDHAGKDGDNLPLPSRARSLKLIRPTPDRNASHQSKAACKNQTLLADNSERSPSVKPEIAPIIVVSDSGSDSEQSDECIILSSTPRDLKTRKTKLRLR